MNTQLPKYTIDEISKHPTWALFDDIVLDLSLAPHPITKRTLIHHGGQNISSIMKSIPDHGNNMWNTIDAMKAFIIGILDDSD